MGDDWRFGIFDDQGRGSTIGRTPKGVMAGAQEGLYLYEYNNTKRETLWKWLPYARALPGKRRQWGVSVSPTDDFIVITVQLWKGVYKYKNNTCRDVVDMRRCDGSQVGRHEEGTQGKGDCNTIFSWQVQLRAPAGARGIAQQMHLYRYKYISLMRATNTTHARRSVISAIGVTAGTRYARRGISCGWM